MLDVMLFYINCESYQYECDFALYPSVEDPKTPEVEADKLDLEVHKKDTNLQYTHTLYNIYKL